MSGRRRGSPRTSCARRSTETAFAAASDEARPILTGVLAQFEGDQLTLAAADNYRIAVKTIPILDAVPETSVVIPARALNELARVLADIDDPVEIVLAGGRNQVLFHLEGVDLVSRLIDGQFPNYQQVVPKEHTTRAVLDREELLRAVRPAALIAHESANIVKLQVGGDGEPGITVSANAEVGDHVGQVEAAVEGDGTTIAFNARYLADVLHERRCRPVRARAQRPAVARRVQADRRRPLRPRRHARPDDLLADDRRPDRPRPDRGDPARLHPPARPPGLRRARGRLRARAAAVWGPNAAGKTSLLEAIVLLAWGRSHRTSADGELIRWGTDLARVEGRARRGTSSRWRSSAPAPTGAPAASGSGSTAWAGGVGALDGPLRVVVFAPGGDAAGRRLARPAPRGARPARERRDPRATRPRSRRYARTLQQRNGLLRAIREEAAVARRAALLGRDLPRCRRRGSSRTGCGCSSDLRRRRSPRPTPRSRPEEAAAASLGLRYATNAPAPPGETPRDALARRLVETADKEVWNGATLIGPHRDDLVFELGGRDLAGFASRGQQRTAILSFKLAELDLLTELDGRPPLLLLDDVFSELDPDRRGAPRPADRGAAPGVRDDHHARRPRPGPAARSPRAGRCAPRMAAPGSSGGPAGVAVGVATRPP